MVKKILSLATVLVMSFVLMTGCFFRCSGDNPDDDDTTTTVAFLSLEDIRERLADVGYFYGIEFEDLETADAATTSTSFNVQTMSSGNTRQPPNMRFDGKMLGFGFEAVAYNGMIMQRGELVGWAEESMVVNGKGYYTVYDFDGADWWYAVYDGFNDSLITVPMGFYQLLHPDFYRTDVQLSNNTQKVWELNQNGINSLGNDGGLADIFKYVLHGEGFNADMIENITITIFPTDKATGIDTVKVHIHWNYTVHTSESFVDEFILDFGGQFLEVPENAKPQCEVCWNIPCDC